MVSITVGQTLNIGIAVWDVCGTAQGIYIYNIGLAINPNPAQVTIKPASCLTISNIGIEFKFVSGFGATACNNCGLGTIYTSLGTVYTNSQGVASLSHTITNTDLTYYQQVSTGDSLQIIACITNSQGQTLSKASICSEPIFISQPVTVEPDYVIKFQLADNPYLSYIEAGIADISVRLISALQFSDIPVQYIRSEMDMSAKTFNVFVKYIGLESSNLYSTTNMYSTDIYSNINSDLNNPTIMSMAILDSLLAFAERALVIIVTIVVAVTIASIILSGGWTLITVGQAVLVGTAIFILGYLVYRIVDDYIVLQDRVNVLQAKNTAGDIRDSTKAGLDDQFNKQPYSKDACLTLITGYQTADTTYLDQMSKELPDLKLSQIKQTYMDCTNALINTFKNSSGTVTDCASARAGITTCANTMNSTTDTEFNTKYPDPTVKKPSACTSDCLICNPIDESCLLSKNVLFYAGLLGIGVVGLLWVSSSHKSGGTITVKAEK